MNLFFFKSVAIPACNMNKENECDLNDFIRVMDLNTIEKKEFDQEFKKNNYFQCFLSINLIITF